MIEKKPKLKFVRRIVERSRLFEMAIDDHFAVLEDPASTIKERRRAESFLRAIRRTSIRIAGLVRKVL